MIGFIIWVIGVVLAVKAVLEIMRCIIGKTKCERHKKRNAIIRV